MSNQTQIINSARDVLAMLTKAAFQPTSRRKVAIGAGQAGKQASNAGRTKDLCTTELRYLSSGTHHRI